MSAECFFRRVRTRSPHTGSSGTKCTFSNGGRPSFGIAACLQLRPSVEVVPPFVLRMRLLRAFSAVRLNPPAGQVRGSPPAAYACVVRHAFVLLQYPVGLITASRVVPAQGAVLLLDLQYSVILRPYASIPERGPYLPAHLHTERLPPSGRHVVQERPRRKGAVRIPVLVPPLQEREPCAKPHVPGKRLQPFRRPAEKTSDQFQDAPDRLRGALYYLATTHISKFLF